MTGLVLTLLVIGFLLLALRVNRHHRELDALSNQLLTEQRIELLTRATLHAMRDVVHRPTSTRD